MKKKVIVCAAAAMLLCLATGVYGNSALQLTRTDVGGASLPAAFEGFKIMHLSDLHNMRFGKNNARLLRLIREQAPDIIAITGDSIDRHRPHPETAIRFLREAVKIAPCYYVPGNHEAGMAPADYAALEQTYRDMGVTVLRDQYVLLSRGEAQIALAGIDDPYFVSDNSLLSADGAEVARVKIRALELPEHTFTVLLSHRPEIFDVYAELGLNLVLSGHAHGGQVRLPLIGGLIAPHQGLFPQYDAGLFTEGKTEMYVSRGLGNSVLPLRINDRPEAALLRLTGGTKEGINHG